jgi:hypothetical protein
MAQGISITVDSKEVTEALEDLSSRDAKKSMQKAVKAGGNFLAQRARANAPSKPRRMKTMTRARNAKRDKPGAVVSTRHRLSPIFQQGTVPRFTKSGAFRGRIEANPFIARTADQYSDEALDIAERELSRLLEL